MAAVKVTVFSFFAHFYSYCLLLLLLLLYLYYMTYRLLQNPVAVAAVAVPYGQQYLVVVVGIPPTAALDSARDAYINCSHSRRRSYTIQM